MLSTLKSPLVSVYNYTAYFLREEWPMILAIVCFAIPFSVLSLLYGWTRKGKRTQYVCRECFELGEMCPACEARALTPKAS